MKILAGRARVSIVAAVSVSGLLLLGPPTAAMAARWLDAGDEPIRADLLVVLGGGSKERVQTALDLFEAGMGDSIMITDARGYPDRLFRFLEDLGVPRRALRGPPWPTTSTSEDALAIRQVVIREGVDSILVVTSPYHCRRARLVLSRSLADLDLTIAVTPSMSLYLHPGGWWRSRQGWITVGLEFPKLLWDWSRVPVVASVGGVGSA